MNINKTIEGKKVTLEIEGIIDTITSTELDKCLLSLDYDGLDLTLDFANTSYITSAGLRVLLVARKKLTDSTMRIINANNEVIEVFKTTGFISMISITGNQESQESLRLSFSSLLKNRVKSDGDRVAYIYKDKEYTWNDINIASKLIADDLAKVGIKKGSHVGICAPNSINWVFSFYAIQRLGAIAVLINPALRPNEVVGICAIGDVECVCYAEIEGVTTFDSYKSLCVNQGKIKEFYNISDCVEFNDLERYSTLKGKHNDLFLADEPSVIIFSSGSTGTPKAILSSSYNTMVAIEPLIKEFKATKEDIILDFLPFFHVFGFASGINISLLLGNVGVIPEKKSPDLLINLIEKYRCTIFNTVPTMYLAIAQSPMFKPEKLSSLRVSVLGGSITTEAQMTMLKNLLPNVHFGNIYGMSENPAISLTKYDDTIAHITQTVGLPVPGLKMEIRDIETNEVVKNGVRGEICIKSDSMVVCYYNLPIEKQPLGDDGFLATGDLGIIDDDGYVRIVGRKKDLIISGGENISPGEICEVLSRMDNIENVLVVGVPDELMGEAVAAAVIVKDKSLWNEEEVKKSLESTLAKYKIPKYFVLYDSFPLLPAGKVDGIKVKEEIIKQIKKQ